MNILPSIRNFFHNTRGVALIEFVLVFPLLMLLVLLGLEFSRFLLIQIKVQKTSYAMANIITQYPPASNTPANAGELSQYEIFTTLGGQQLVKMLSPYNDANTATMIVTSVRNEVATYSKQGLVVKWQVCSSGASGCAQNSIITQTSVPGMAGFTKNTTANFLPPYNVMVSDMRDGENMVVVEISYPYTPLYTSLLTGIGKVFPVFSFPGISAQTITHVAFFSPRNLGTNNGGLSCLPPAISTDVSNANIYFSYQDCPCLPTTYAAGCTTLSP